MARPTNLDKVEKTIEPSKLNLQHLAKLPSEFYNYSPFSGKLELCESVDSIDLRSVSNDKGVVTFAMVVFEPLQLILTDDREIADISLNKPQVTSLPFLTIKSALETTIKGFFLFKQDIIDKQDNIVLGQRERNYFQINSTLELYAFAKCVKAEDILEPIKDRSKNSESNASIKKYANEVVNSIKNIVIGTTKIPVTNILHIPFSSENPNIPALITEEYLEGIYQKIITR